VRLHLSAGVVLARNSIQKPVIQYKKRSRERSMHISLCNECQAQQEELLILPALYFPVTPVREDTRWSPEDASLPL